MYTSVTQNTQFALFCILPAAKEAAVHDTTSDIATNSMAIDQMMSELSDIKELLPAMLGVRTQGRTPTESGGVLGIKKTKLYDSLNTIERIAEKYF